jgi:hypothetical protein
VIVGELVELAVAQEVGTGITDVPHAHAGAVDQQRNQCRAGSAQRGVGVGDVGEPPRRGVHRRPEGAEQVDVVQLDAVEQASTSATALMASALATSPWACPPIPSATARRRELVYAESWFTARRCPMSDPAAERTVGVMGLPSQQQLGCRSPVLPCRPNRSDR